MTCKSETDGQTQQTTNNLQITTNKTPRKQTNTQHAHTAHNIEQPETHTQHMAFYMTQPIHKRNKHTNHFNGKHASNDKHETQQTSE